MQALNPTLSTWEDVLARLGCSSVCWQGLPLSDRDRRTYTEAIVLCALHLTDLSTRFGGVGSQRDFIAWATNVVTLDVLDVGSFLSDSVALLRTIEAPTTYSWFKRQLRQKYPFTGMLLAPIRECLTSFLESPTYRGFYVCYQFLSFLTHLTLIDVEVDLEGEYEDTESYLRTIEYDPRTCAEMNSIMREWMAGFSIQESNFHPSHGPGAVAEQSATSGQLAKYQYLGTDPLLVYAFKKFAGVDVATYFPFEAKALDRTSVVVFVPKSMKTRRSISKEPATLQYLQQGVSRCLVDYIHGHSDLSQHINLRRQDLNASLAIRSSGTGAFATIDLSSASDTVTTTLVKTVFRGTPALPFLVALRSRTAVLPSGKTVQLEKFAPMGSALCFPIQTLLFSCAVELAVRRRSFWDPVYTDTWRVYGDDIIVPDVLFTDAVELLEQLGFRVNVAKSYSKPYRFRESCGGEGYDGRAVTPLKISRRYAAVEKGLSAYHASLYEGLMSMANSCYTYGFTLLRAWLIRVLLDNQIAPPPFSEEGDGTLISLMPDNYRARRRFNKKLFRLEHEVAVCRAPSVRTSAKANRLDDEANPSLAQARYFETLRLIETRSSDMFSPDHRVQVPRRAERLRIVKTWVDLDHPSGRSVIEKPWLSRSIMIPVEVLSGDMVE